jgi:cardiolipin synthase (CMP-forming)
VPEPSDVTRAAVQTLLMTVARWRVADAITWVRLLSLPFIWWLALDGQGRLVAFGLILAGLTDFLDGFVARRLGQESTQGARLDAIADVMLLVSAAIWLGLLHPDVVGENAGLLAVTAAVYFTSLSIGLLRFRRIGNLHLYSAKAAGALLYLFAVATLASGAYSRLLLTLAAAALMVSAAETTAAHLFLSAADGRLGSVLLILRSRTETRTIQAMGSDSRHRSQAPAANDVDSKASPTSSIPNSPTPTANETGP